MRLLPRERSDEAPDSYSGAWAKYGIQPIVRSPFVARRPAPNDPANLAAAPLAYAAAPLRGKPEGRTAREFRSIGAAGRMRQRQKQEARRGD